MRVNSVEPLGHGWGCLLRQRAESQESGLHICREKDGGASTASWAVLRLPSPPGPAPPCLGSPPTTTPGNSTFAQARSPTASLCR